MSALDYEAGPFKAMNETIHKLGALLEREQLNRQELRSLHEELGELLVHVYLDREGQRLLGEALQRRVDGLRAELDKAITRQRRWWPFRGRPYGTR